LCAPKKFALQPARYEPLADDEKTHPLCDTFDFSSGAKIEHLQRNLLEINRIGAKIGPRKNSQFLVTYNNKHFLKREMRRVFIEGMKKVLTESISR
jgi:hypothetical protein